MSQVIATRPERLEPPAPRPSAPRTSGLRLVVPSAKGRPKAVYALIAVGLLLGVIVAQLLLSILVTQGAYRLDALHDEQSALELQSQAASERLDVTSSPQNLAQKAESLGMVHNAAPVYLRLSDGKVLGAAAAAHGRTVGGASAPLVPNALLAAEEAEQSPAPQKARDSGSSPVEGSEKASADSGRDAHDAPTEAAPSTPRGPVAWKGTLPAPTTH